MKKIIGVIVAVAVAAGGYFGGQAMGLFGEKALSVEEIATVLSARAAEINESGNLQYDTWSRLVSATHIEKKITIRGNSKLDAERLGEDYLESRVAQAANFLCHDETMRAALAGGAEFQYFWFSKDDVQLGGVHAYGTTYCEDAGY